MASIRILIVLKLEFALDNFFNLSQLKYHDRLKFKSFVLFCLVSFPIIKWHLSSNYSYWYVIITEIFCYSYFLPKISMNNWMVSWYGKYNNLLKKKISIGTSEDKKIYYNLGKYASCVCCNENTVRGTYPGIFVLIHKTPTVYHLVVMISKKTWNMD